MIEGSEPESLPVLIPTIGIDFGGTKLEAVLFKNGLGASSCRHATAETQGNLGTLIGLISDVIEGLDPGAEARHVGIAIAGRVDAGGRVVIQSANLGLSDVPLAELLEDALGRGVSLINDVQAALLAESAVGAVRGCSDVFMVSLGTGVGGAVLTHGELLRGAFNSAGEIGHTVIDPGGRTCNCGALGCYEQYASGHALVHTARSAGLQVEDGHAVFEAALAGNETAIGAFENVGTWAGRGIATAIGILDSEAVIVGGGLAAAGPLLLDPLMQALGEELRNRGREEMPRVLPPKWKRGATIGAALAAEVALSC